MNKIISFVLVVVCLFVFSLPISASYEPAFQPKFKDVLNFPLLPDEYFNLDDYPYQLLLRHRTSGIFIFMFSPKQFEVIYKHNKLVNSEFANYYSPYKFFASYTYDPNSSFEWVYNGKISEFNVAPYGDISLDAYDYDFYYLNFDVNDATSGGVLTKANGTDFIKVTLAISSFKNYLNITYPVLTRVVVGCLSGLILLWLLGRWARSTNKVIKSYKRNYKGGKKIWKKQKRF